MYNVPLQSVPFTTKFVSLTPPYGEVYLLKLYMIKFASQVFHDTGFLTGSLVFSSFINDHHNIPDVFLMVELRACNL